MSGDLFIFTTYEYTLHQIRCCSRSQDTQQGPFDHVLYWKLFLHCNQLSNSTSENTLSPFLERADCFSPAPQRTTLPTPGYATRNHLTGLPFWPLRSPPTKSFSDQGELAWLRYFFRVLAASWAFPVFTGGFVIYLQLFTGHIIRLGCNWLSSQFPGGQHRNQWCGWRGTVTSSR